MTTFQIALSIITSLVGISGTIIAIIVFIRNGKKSQSDEGRWRQSMEDKVDNGFRSVNERVDVIAEDVREVKGELKKATTRMVKLCALHSINHPGQVIE
jgi:hypothetical protein